MTFCMRLLQVGSHFLCTPIVEFSKKKEVTMEIPERRKGRIEVKRICSASYSKDQIVGESRCI